MEKTKEISGSCKDKIREIWKTPVQFGNTSIVVKYVIYKAGYCRMYTDDLKYGRNLEIVFDNKKQCFTIKNLAKLRKQWAERHAESVESTNDLDDFIGLVVE